MSKCIRCQVEILDETERCPLCDSVLEKTVEVENMYPDVRIKSRKMSLISRIYLFCAILAEAVLIYLNVVLESRIWWCVITGLSLLYVYLVMRFAIIGKSGYKAKVTVLMMIGLSMVIIIDFVAGYNGWSVNYVLPAGILLVDAGIVVLMIVNIKSWQSYLVWQIFMILCSLVPFILYLLKIVTKPGLTVIAMGCSFFLFLGTVIIGDRRARVELKRRFHIR